MSHPPKDLNDLAQLATETFLAAQAETLRLLDAEMHALALIMPGAHHPAAQPQQTDTEIEQGFDNMPV